MICLESGKAPKMAPLRKAPLILRIFLISAAIFVMMITMAAIEKQNEPFEALANPRSQDSGMQDPNWDLLAE